MTAKQLHAEIERIGAEEIARATEKLVIEGTKLLIRAHQIAEAEAIEQAKAATIH